MQKKKMLQALMLCATVSLISLALTKGDVSATNTIDILPASGFSLELEEGVSIEEIYVEPVEQVSVLDSDQITAVAEDAEEEILTDDIGTFQPVDLASIDNTAVGIATASSLEDIQDSDVQISTAESTEDVLVFITSAVSVATEKSEQLNEIRTSEAEAEAAKDPENFSNLVIADVNNYVNVRDIPSTDGEVVGKLYDDSVGEFLGEEDGWYKIKSGNVTGYVKAEFCVTGDAAIELAKEVGQRMAMVNTTTLKVREEPSTESAVLGLVPIEEDLSVTEELDGWVKVSIEEGEGYVSTDYVVLRTDFVHAESKEEEEARLEKERKEKEAAQAAARKAQAQQTAPTTSSSGKTYTAPSITSDGSMGSSVAQYACQFVGNPYVYGGTSLTNGTDCSGFVMSVYNAFGVSLPHSSSADRSQGYAVEGGLANAQPGDIVCYSGHVALYIGNGQIVHASTSKTGIVISNAAYRNVLAVRRIF